MLNRLLAVVPRLWANWIALLGTTLATVAGNGILIVVVVDIVSSDVNPYMASFGYLVMPMLFLVGLALVALGLRRESRRRRARGVETPFGRAYTTVMQDPASRRRVLFFGFATVINLTLISVAAFKGVTYMESTEFCGQLCHSVMKPEYTAYRRSPHAHVACVDCHIGEGADWFVRSKLSGLRQVWATFTGNFSRPIPTPIHHLRPARETCQHCHWPAQFHGSRLRVHHSYKNDLKNSQVTSVVRLNVGGINRRTGRYEGIHWHVAPDVRIEYEALDGKRKVIGKVTKTEKGKTTVYLPSKRTGQVAERRVMDCVDCHNRPTHIYDASPQGAVDRSLSLGKLDPALPFLRRQAVALLRENVVPEQAAARFARELRQYYDKHYPEMARTRAQSIDKAGRELGWIYRRNIYPELKIGWNTYPSHLGHRQTTFGCFRCHDDEHVAQRARSRGASLEWGVEHARGRAQRRSPARERSGARNTSQSASGEKQTIPQDCDLCHEVMAEEEARPDVPPGILRLGHM